MHVVSVLAALLVAVSPAAVTSAPVALSAPPTPAPATVPAEPAPPTVIPFRTEALPRIDPVFGDAATLRAAVDRFLALQGEMDRVRDEFAGAVHETLSAVQSLQDRGCTDAVNPPYARALASGARYLALGQELAAKYRDIRRSDDLGDSVGLTPDYRWKVRKARELYRVLLTDYREMRVAFYDQLGTELRHAGCKPGKRAANGAAKSGDPAPPNPSDPSAWQLDEAPAELPVTGHPHPTTSPAAPTAEAAGAIPATAPLASTAPAIWIDIDNTLCEQPTRLTIDGVSLGELAGHKKTSVRTRAGPHELCVLTTSDPRACGTPGTLRKAYLHEGWSLTVHCPK